MACCCRAAAVLALCLSAGPLAADMVDPATDGLGGPFAYLAKPSGLLGGVGASGATQVTWDGALYTGAAELCVVTGDPPRPVAVRVKRLGGGYLPIVYYSWLEGDVRLTVSAFAVALSQGGDPANFVRLQMARLGDSGRAASIGIGLRYSGLDHRSAALQRGESNPASQYAFERGCALIDGQAVYILSSTAPSRRYAVAEVPYQRPFAGSEYGVGPTTAVLLSMWDLGESKELAVDLKMPWTPLPADSPQSVQALRQAGYDDYAQQVAEAWEAELGRGMRILLPESKPLDACQANLAYLLMSTEIPKQGRPRFHDHLRGLIEPAAQSAAFAQALDESGRPDLARDALEAWLDTQGPDGCLSPEKDADEHCRVLTALIEHAWLTGDRTWAERVYPQVKTAADWLLSAMEADKTPPALSPFLTVEALGEVGEMAALVGKQEDAAIFRAQRDRALATTQTTLASEPLAGAAAPSILGLNRGLPDSPGAGFVSPHAEHVTELCRRLHTSYAEGLATEGGFLSPLLTMELARLHALRGEQEQALRDLYAVLVHTGSCQEGFAGGVRPWADRDSGESWSPDPRFSAAYMGLLRDLLIREQRDELHLFSAWSPEWLQPGKLVGVYNAPTSFGLVTAAMQIEEGGAALVMAADWHAAPSRVVLHLPYCVDVTSVSADRPGLKQDEGPPPSEYEGEDLPAAGSQGATAYLELRPDTTQVTIKWTPRADALLSYESAVEAWQAAYAARYARYLNAGKEPLAVEPIPLR